MLITIIVKQQLVDRKRIKKKKRKTAQIGTNVGARVFNAGLLARSQFASGRSCDQPTRSRFSVVFLGPRANAELAPKFHVALHASHAALPMVTLEITPYTNVTLTLGWTILLMRDMGDSALHRQVRKYLSNKKTENLVMVRHQDELADRSSVAI
jgi:hypothetical protein